MSLKDRGQIVKAVIILLLVFLSAGFVVAQSNLFEQGYMILNSGDTLFGYIQDQAEKENLFLSVTYSDNQAGENPVTYTPYEVNEYYYEPGFCFVSRDNTVENDPGKLFLQCLVNGYASLYFYYTAEKSLFIIEKEGESDLILEE